MEEMEQNGYIKVDGIDTVDIYHGILHGSNLPPPLQVLGLFFWTFPGKV